jgi:hypothetical protein
MSGLIKLAVIAGAVGLASAIKSYHAEEEGEDLSPAELRALYLRERISNLVAEGADHDTAATIANRELDEAEAEGMFR